jgi:ATP synthase protein I
VTSGTLRLNLKLKKEERAIGENPGQQQSQKQETGQPRWVQAASLSYLGLFFGISVVIGMSFGGWLDKKLHTAPWLRIIGVLLGIATGFNELYRVTKRYQRKLSQQAKDAPPAPALEARPTKDLEEKSPENDPQNDIKNDSDERDPDESEQKKRGSWV